MKAVVSFNIPLFIFGRWFWNIVKKLRRFFFNSTFSNALSPIDIKFSKNWEAFYQVGLLSQDFLCPGFWCLNGFPH